MGRWIGGCCRATVAAALLVMAVGTARAGDHADAPATSADPAADIASFYAWHTESDRLVVVLTFAPLEMSATGTYDADVLYGVHIDTDADQEADTDIWVRFGQNPANDWGLRVDGLPGSGGPVVGAVETTIDAGGGGLVWAGPADDPFFFDMAGFQNTVSTGTFSFDSGSDSFAGLDVTAIVLEMDLSAAVGEALTADLWATTGRREEVAR